MLLRRNEKKARQQEKHRPFYTIAIMLSRHSVIHRIMRTQALQMKLITGECGQVGETPCGYRPDRWPRGVGRAKGKGPQER